MPNNINSPEFLDDMAPPSDDPLDAIVVLADSISAHIELFRPHVQPNKLEAFASELMTQINLAFHRTSTSSTETKP